MNRILSLALACAVVSLSSFAVAQEEKTPIRICTGAEDGVYYEIGTIFRKWSKNQPIEVIESSGSLDNIEKVIAGECDAFISQPDALNQAAATTPRIKKLFRPVGALHREYLHVLCNREAGHEDLSDLEGTEEKLNIGPPGSGSWTTWQNLVKEDSGYESIKTESDPNDLALSSVASGETACMLVASGLHSGSVDSADQNYGDSVTLVGANDKDFNDATSIDGKTLYSYSEIDGVYPNLNGGWGVDTLSWSAQVYASTEALDSKELSALAKTVASARGEIIGRWGK